MGFGPFIFGKEENPFPFVTNIFLLTTLTFVGYQPTGINPLERL